jgi:hypothetical protein
MLACAAPGREQAQRTHVRGRFGAPNPSLAPDRRSDIDGLQVVVRVKQGDAQGRTDRQDGYFFVRTARRGTRLSG